MTKVELTRLRKRLMKMSANGEGHSKDLAKAILVLDESIWQYYARIMYLEKLIVKLDRTVSKVLAR